MKAWATRALASPRGPWLAAAAAMALSLPSLSMGFLVDDWVHRAMFLREPGLLAGAANMFAFVPGLEQASELLAVPWWAAPDLKLSLFRPLTGLTHWIDYAVWADSPALMHLHNIAWYGIAVVAVGVLFRRLMGATWVAGLAAVVYGISHTHSVPVFFIANRNALVGVTFSALALILHHSWRSTCHRLAALLAPLALMLGLFGNEGAVATLGYLAGYAWFIDRSTWRSRIVSLLPSAVVVVLWRIVYSALGHGAWASEAYIDPVRSPFRFLEAVAVRGPILLNAQWLLPPADFAAALPADLMRQWATIATVLLIGLAVVLVPLLRRDPLSRFWGLGMLLAIVPACATFPMDRLLMHADIGFAALFAQLVSFATSAEFARGATLIRRLVTRVTVTVLVAIHVVLTVIWLPGLMFITADAFSASTRGIERLAQRPDLTGKIVVLLDDALTSGMYFHAFRELAGLPPPAAFMVLSPAVDRGAQLSARRESPNTLVLEHVSDYPWFLERDSLHPFAAGETVRRDPITVEVRTVSNGKPMTVAFHFDRPLDDPSIVWLERIQPAFILFPRDGDYPVWTPPLVGRTVSVR